MTSSLSQNAYERIQAMLLRSDIVSGAKISEEKLATELGISRTPVREAIRRLQFEGVLYQRPSSGTFVASPNRRALIETYEVRMALEQFAVQKAVRRMTSADVAELDRYCRDMLNAVRAFRDSGLPVMDGAALRDFLVADLSFHMLLMKSAGNQYMLKLIGDVHVRNRIFGSHSHKRTLRHAAKVWQFHARIARAVRIRDAASARRWLIRHMKMSLREALKTFDRSRKTELPVSLHSESTIHNLITSCRELGDEYTRRNKKENRMAAGTESLSDDNLALQAPLIITAPGEEYGDGKRIFQGIPAIERSPKGRLWAAWYSGGDNEGPDNYVVLVTSGDDGKTWTPPALVVDPAYPVRAYDQTLWVDPAGRLWLFWAQAKQWWDNRGGVWAMVTENPDDASPTWSAPVRIADGVMMNKPTVLKNGTWLAPISVWQRSGKDKHPSVNVPLGAGVFQSVDQGKSWSFLGCVEVPAANAEFEEHMVVELDNGDLRMLVRTNYGIGESKSTDGGKTWSPLWPSSFEHTSARFFFRRLASGKILMVKHSPPTGFKQRSHLTAYLSEDDGQSWKGGLLLDERNGVSYPDGAQGLDGRIYIIYDFDRYGQKTINLALFTEADVMAGHFIDPQSRLNVLINQAFGKK